MIVLYETFARLGRLALFGVGALALVYGLLSPAWAQSDGCGIPMVRDETTGEVHLLQQGACPQAPCQMQGGTGNCLPYTAWVQGTGGPEPWQVCICTRLVPNGEGGYTVVLAAVDCLEGFRAWGPETPTVGMGKCIKLTCPHWCHTWWNEHPQDPEVSVIECGCVLNP